MTAGIINSEVINYYSNNKKRIIKKPVTQIGIEMLNNEFAFLDYAPVLQEICIDIGVSDNPFFIMDYRGETLQSKLANNALNIPLSRLLHSIAIATNQISGFIHGDIKPENILIYNDEIYFIDYGCSKLIPGKALAFTQEYADKGLINNGFLDYSSDKFSFAKVLRKIYLYYIKNIKLIDVDLNAVNECIDTIFEKPHLLSWNNIRILINKACSFSNFYFKGITNEVICQNLKFDYYITRGKQITLGCMTGTYSGK